ncbi:MAG: NADH-quinone oxidoreductase subunit J family protein [Caldisphaera sp.]|jgi:NADH-quinone oxidoreductase subunit J|nr:NADH-quinone oxidoreductase subunit J [Caldisphaera sp.]PMP61073.1 MAG: NADH-quinone oxidoreductase subunit J [Caldisphaera sp.]
MSVYVSMPLFAIILGIASIVASYFVIKTKDLVYSSSMLAVLASIIAALLALIGYGIVAAFQVLIYVGAAVMFIIIAISMVGSRGRETKESFLGFIVGTSLAISIALILIGGRLYNLYTYPSYVSPSQAAQGLLDHYFPVVALILIAQAATLVEAISISKRGDAS